MVGASADCRLLSAAAPFITKNTIPAVITPTMPSTSAYCFIVRFLRFCCDVLRSRSRLLPRPPPRRRSVAALRHLHPRVVDFLLHRLVQLRLALLELAQKLLHGLQRL